MKYMYIFFLCFRWINRIPNNVYMIKLISFFRTSRILAKLSLLPFTVRLFKTIVLKRKIRLLFIRFASHMSYLLIIRCSWVSVRLRISYSHLFICHPPKIRNNNYLFFSVKNPIKSCLFLTFFSTFHQINSMRDSNRFYYSFFLFIKVHLNYFFFFLFQYIKFRVNTQNKAFKHSLIRLSITD